MRANSFWLGILAVPLASAAINTASAAIIDSVEYYNPTTKHWFRTSDSAEIATYDGNVAWTRSGLNFKVWQTASDAPTGALPACQYSAPIYGADVRYYGVDPFECNFLSNYPGAVYQGAPFYALMPAGGVCANGAQPVYRNFAFDNDVRFRFSTTLSAYQETSALAGYQAHGVVFCVPSTTAWTKYLGAHYTNTPNASGLNRNWAGGGLRYPGGNGSQFKPALSGATYVDEGIATFTSVALPLINTLLGDGKYAVLGAAPAGSVFLDSMATPSGREAYRKSIGDRVDQIAALPNGKGWEKKIYFQFGNEISNNNSTGFYGAVCLWITRNNPTPVANCDLTTQFIPTYAEYFLAPGIAHLEEKSQALFGRPDALHAMTGSIVNLSNREAFLDSLLQYKIVGTYAPAYAGRIVYDLVDTVSIHYTVTTPTWRTTLDNFRNKYLPGGVPSTRVRALWTTEEGGVRTAEQGYGMASALRGIARYLSWWQANNVSPDDGHVYYWGTEINRPSGGACTGCTSVDQDMPVFYNFVGDNVLTELTQDKSIFGVSGSFESYEFAVGGQSKRALIGFVPSNSGSATLSTLTLNLASWAGRTVSVSAFKFANQGPQPLAVTPASVIAGPSVLVNVSATVAGLDAIVFFVEAK